MLKKFFFIITIFLLSITLAKAENSFSASPAVYVFIDVELGQKIKVPNSIFVINKDENNRFFNFELCTPSDINIKPPAGYSEPETLEWFTLSPTTFKLKSKESGLVDIYLNIPDKPEYSKKKYIVFVRVKREALSTISYIAYEPFILVYYLKYVIETK